MTTFQHSVTEIFKVVSCYTCGVRFGIEAQLYTRVVTDAEGSIYCPACGNKTCWRESEKDKRIKELNRKLEWEVAEVQRQKSARENVELSLRSTQGVITKMKKRASAGVCPCCNRTFQQLARHMRLRHPNFSK